MTYSIEHVQFLPKLSICVIRVRMADSQCRRNDKTHCPTHKATRLALTQNKASRGFVVDTSLSYALPALPSNFTVVLQQFAARNNTCAFHLEFRRTQHTCQSHNLNTFIAYHASHEPNIFICQRSAVLVTRAHLPSNQNGHPNPRLPNQQPTHPYLTHLRIPPLRPINPPPKLALHPRSPPATHPTRPYPRAPQRPRRTLGSYAR